MWLWHASQNVQKLKNVKNENLLAFLQRFLNVAVCLQSYRRKAEDFSFISSSGHGAFGRVQLVREITTGCVCAMKVINKSRMLAQHTDYWAEKEIMSHSESPRIVELYYAYQDLKNLYMIMEYVPGDAGGHLKLADFGTAIRVDPETSLIHCDAAVGTPDYFSPEVLLSQGIGGGSYGFEVDWWALDAVIYDMLYGVTPFYSETLVNTYANIVNHANILKFPEKEPEGRLHTKDLSNPIHASRCGQEALQDMLSGLRDLMLLFYACMDPKTRGVSTHQASIAGPQCVETLQHMKSNKELLQQAFHVVKESCDRLLPADVSDLVPYVDTPIMNREPSLELKQLIIAREKVIKRLLTVTEELEKLRRILTKTVWELNDLTDPNVQKF
ncbi:unnamed protein product [Schistosoma curassoni]|nr:unnamed protein product [Schistosoma curassoni]